MKLGLKVTLTIACLAVVVGVGSLLVEKVNGHYESVGKKKYEVAGLAMGRVSNYEQSVIMLKVGDNSKPVRVNAEDPRKFTVKGSAICDTKDYIGGVWGFNHDAERLIENCVPAQP